MRMTPMEIRQQQFDTQLFRGCDVQQVDAYLNNVASDYEELMKENSLLKEQLTVLEERARGIEEREKLLQETLVAAQRMSEELKENARQLSEEVKGNAQREAQLIVREAELQAEKLMEAARAEEAKIKEEILNLRRTRHQVAESLRASIEGCQRLIDQEFQKNEGIS